MAQPLPQAVLAIALAPRVAALPGLAPLAAVGGEGVESRLPLDPPFGVEHRGLALLDQDGAEAPGGVVLDVLELRLGLGGAGQEGEGGGQDGLAHVGYSLSG